MSRSDVSGNGSPQKSRSAAQLGTERLQLARRNMLTLLVETKGDTPGGANSPATPPVLCMAWSATIWKDTGTLLSKISRFKRNFQTNQVPELSDVFVILGSHIILTLKLT